MHPWYDPYESQLIQLARDMIGAHGPLREVAFLQKNENSLLVFADGVVIPTLGATNMLTFGYHGQGPRYFSTFLSTAGFKETNVENINPPLKLRADGSQVRGTERAGLIEWEDGSETPTPIEWEDGSETPTPTGVKPTEQKKWWQFWK